MKHLTVVIPSRDIRPSRKTLDSLQKQTFQDFVIVVQIDCGFGANWARNRGFELCRTEFVLFSDDDIEWQPDAFETLIDCLDAHPEAAYCYGAYVSTYVADNKDYLVGNRHFDAHALRQSNFVSTMSLLRAKDFPGFDESLKRLQDWDLWLNLLSQGKTGVYCDKVLFRTVTRPDGITFGSIPWQDAFKPIKEKYGL